jgi:sulfite reductase (NADPH) flavoprotein alpha-component
VCGAVAMGQAVHQALLAVAAEGGGLNAEAAREFVEGLRSAGRYHRDLY